MRSQPTMLHVRASTTEVLLAGQHVPMLRLIERVGGGWGKSRIDALCQWPGAADWARGLAADDSLLVELHDLHAYDGDMRGVIRQQPHVLPRPALDKGQQPLTKPQRASATPPARAC